MLITRLAHRQLDLTVEIGDVIPPGEQALFRRITVSKSPQVGPVQFTHYFRLTLGDVTHRNAVQVNTEKNLVVQHFRDIALAVSATEPLAVQCGCSQNVEESLTKQGMRSGDFGTCRHTIGQVDFAVGFEPIAADRWQTTLILAGGNTRESAMASVQRLIDIPYEEAVRLANERVAGELGDAGPCPLPEFADAFDRAVISGTGGLY